MIAQQQQGEAGQRQGDVEQQQGEAEQQQGEAEQQQGEVEQQQQPGPGLFLIPTPLGTIRVTKKMIFKIIGGILFVLLLNLPVVEGKEANRCFAILMFCTFLWATEVGNAPTLEGRPTSNQTAGHRAVRYFNVIRDDAGNVMPRPDATKWVFSVMFCPTIMLLIGGFTISSALSKTNIDRFLITKVLSLAGSKPSNVLLAFMGVSCFASMWISNVAAPTLCFTLIRPVLQGLDEQGQSEQGQDEQGQDEQGQDDRSASFGRCLILAIALAANIGGQSSPISSPQNIIALQAMDPPLDWARWFAVSLPVSGISIVLIWGMLLFSYGPGETEISPIQPTDKPFTHKQWWVTIVCLVTISLWCVAHEIEDYVGDMGIIAIIPVVAFFSTGVLKKDDFDRFMWTIVFLAMGGIALGQGVMSSGLLNVMSLIVRDLVNDVSLYSVVLILSPIVLSLAGADCEGSGLKLTRKS
ncbi:hypothetical protein DXG01_010801 [Tephrocybe rancida]|nr:hypothetical protein DXG01_010801 [Tephrocybe rancida]